MQYKKMTLSPPESTALLDPSAQYFSISRKAKTKTFGNRSSKPTTWMFGADWRSRASLGIFDQPKKLSEESPLFPRTVRRVSCPESEHVVRGGSAVVWWHDAFVQLV